MEEANNIIVEKIRNSKFASNGNFRYQDHDEQDNMNHGEDEEVEKDSSSSSSSVYRALSDAWAMATTTTTSTTSLQNDELILLLDEWFHRLWTLHTEPSRHYHTVVHILEIYHYLQLLLLSLSEEKKGIITAANNNNETTSLSTYNNTSVAAAASSSSCATTTTTTTATTRTSSSTTIEKNRIFDHLDDEEMIRTILLSIFFHDAIYDAKSATNEEDSAILFESFADQMTTNVVSPEQKNTVVNFILATKQHKAPPTSNNPKNDDALLLFLDLDMAVLGKDEEAYRQYASLIRHEYEFVDHDEYCQKRADVLEVFLRESRIYRTSIMYEAFEARSRSNLQKEIVSLRKGIIPILDEEDNGS